MSENCVADLDDIIKADQLVQITCEVRFGHDTTLRSGLRTIAASDINQLALRIELKDEEHEH